MDSPTNDQHIISDKATQTTPDFIIIGAQKSGTTWLVDMLRDHEGVFIPRDEVHFFNGHFDKGIDWYASHFNEASKNQCIGEKTPDYLGGASAD